jgi:hypothetical protein
MPWQNVGSPFVVISPDSGAIYIYNGAPGLGTLAASFIASSVAFPGIAATDQYGNNALAGETWYGGASDLYAYINNNAGVTTYGFASGPQPSTFPAADAGTVSALISDGIAGINVTNFLAITGPPSNANTSVIQNSNLATLEYVNANDGNTYLMGKNWQHVATGTVINETSPTPILSWNVEPNDFAMIYHFKVQIVILENANAGTWSIGWNGSLTVGASVAVDMTNTATSTFPGLHTSATMTAGQLAFYEAEGAFVVSTSGGGVLNLRMNVSNAADTATVLAASWGYIEPMQ